MYEFGIIAMILFIVFVGVTIYRLRDKPGPFVTAVMYAVSMFVYYPLHFAAPMLLGAYLVAESVSGPDSELFKDPGHTYDL